ncbi:MAG: hydrogenase maturation nickel metallochaperone HypA [Enterobacterales bacterium]|nr:hydrogenase maturation nickel metallochaperone HypA [Enterobacterales bacterium]
MHELGITRNIVSIVSEQAKKKRVKKITLDIGKLSAILPDSIRFCFDICSKGTTLENAELKINEIQGIAKCKNCDNEFEIEQLFGRCVCGSNDIKCIAGEEMKIKEMEII